MQVVKYNSYQAQKPLKYILQIKNFKYKNSKKIKKHINIKELRPIQTIYKSKTKKYNQN